MFVWLIEYTGLDMPIYVYCPEDGPWEMVFRPWKASQFPDKESAELRIKELNLVKSWVAREHGFTK